MPNSNTDPSYNNSQDPRQPQAAPYPIMHQPHTTDFSSRPLAGQAADSGFSGSYGHAERDPHAIRSYRGSEDAGAPADLQRSYSDPRQSQGQTGSVSDTGVSRVSYNNQAPAPKQY